MKKYFKIIIPLIFIGVLSYFGFEIYTKIQHKKEVAENIKTIPKFEYQNSNGGLFTNESLKKDTPTLFIYFNTECEFCNEEAQMIKENILLGQVETPENILLFLTTFGFDAYFN